MSNALLAVSGPAFGNMDVTVYDVYSVMSKNAVDTESNAVTIFSGHSWTWALIDLTWYGYVIPRPFTISNSVSITNTPWNLNSLTSIRSCSLSLYGTSTSLKGGFNDGTSFYWTMTAYVPVV